MDLANHAAAKALETEKEHERLMVEQGRARAVERISRRPAAVYAMQPQVQNLLAEAFGKVVARIEVNMAEAEATNDSYGMQAVNAINAVGKEQAAFLGLLEAFFVSVHVREPVSRNKIARTTVEIGRGLEIQCFCTDLNEQDPKLWKKLFKKATAENTSYLKRFKTIRRYGMKRDFEWEVWPLAKKARVGGFVFDAVLAGAQLFELDPEDFERFRLREDVRRHLKECDERESWMYPVVKPMLVRPKEWGCGNSNPYFDDHLGSYANPVRGINSYPNEQRSKVYAQIDSDEPPAWIEALNHIQNTSFRINKRVLEAVRMAKDKGLSLPSFPRFSPIDPVEIPPDFDQLPPEVRRRIKRQRADVYKRSRENDADVIKFNLDLESAEELSQYSSFWLPMSCDWRGRVYPIPTFQLSRPGLGARVFRVF